MEDPTFSFYPILLQNTRDVLESAANIEKGQDEQVKGFIHFLKYANKMKDPEALHQFLQSKQKKIGVMINILSTYPEKIQEINAAILKCEGATSKMRNTIEIITTAQEKGTTIIQMLNNANFGTLESRARATINNNNNITTNDYITSEVLKQMFDKSRIPPGNGGSKTRRKRKTAFSLKKRRTHKR